MKAEAERPGNVSTSILLILASVACSVVGQLALKSGMSAVGRIGQEALGSPLALLLRVFTQPQVLFGLGCYVLGALAWLAVLSRVPLSLAYPSLALSYVLTTLLAWLLLGEQVPTLRWAGIGLICLGVVLISRTS